MLYYIIFHSLIQSICKYSKLSGAKVTNSLTKKLLHKMNKRQCGVNLFYFTNKGRKKILFKNQTTTFSHLSSSAWVWHCPIFPRNKELPMFGRYASAICQICTVNTMWWSKYVQSHYWPLVADLRTPKTVHRSSCSVKICALESTVSSTGPSWLSSESTK